MKNDGSGLPQSLIYGEGSINKQVVGENQSLPIEEIRRQAKILLDNYDEESHLSDKRHKDANIIPFEKIHHRPCRCHKH